jgi:predicted permease
MLTTFFSIIFVYIFILLGFLAKRIFKEEIHPKSLTIMSVYFLQPFVTIWGFSSTKLHFEDIYVPLLYLAIILTLLLPMIALSKFLFKDPKKQAIFSIAGFVGNTGNIGIPLALTLFGQEAVIYATLINLANVFVIYVLGVYIYSRGSFSVKESIKNIFKIPIIPASVVAVLININEVTIPKEIFEAIKMGAYAGIVLQLFLLGTFLAQINKFSIDTKLFFSTLAQKFLLIPIATAFILSFTPFNDLIKGVIFMQMLTPLAVANINVASLYNCHPQSVSTLIFASTLLFLPVLLIMQYWL